MREAKTRRRMDREAAPAEVIGTVVFEGTAFGGRHTVRLLARAGGRAVDVEADGRLACVRTYRGARALLLRRMFRSL